MKTSFRPFQHWFASAAIFSAFVFISHTEAQDAIPSAQELSSRLSKNLLDGSSLVRLKLEITQSTGGSKTVLQLQVRSRRTKSATEIVYYVLWPKERKGESFLLRKTIDHTATGTVFTLPDTLTPISSFHMKDGIFGSDLSYEDLLENFYEWENQTLVGTETVDRVPCQIIESKPDKDNRSSYSKVRSWIDIKRMVPLRVEKYLSSGQLARRIDTTRVSKDDTDRLVPSTVTVQRPGQTTITELEGSNSKHDITFKDADFTQEALRSLFSTK